MKPVTIKLKTQTYSAVLLTDVAKANPSLSAVVLLFKFPTRFKPH
jgi:hypothetical protein